MSVTAKNYLVKTTPHQPFPISNFENALFLAREPWLSPKDAFTTVEDARAFRGQIVKRGGLSMFAEISNSGAATRTIKTSASGSGALRNSTWNIPSRPVINSIIFDNNAGPAGAGATIYATVTNMRQTSIIGQDAWLWDVVSSTVPSVVIGSLVFLWSGTWQANVTWPSHPLWVGQSTDEGYISYWVNPETEIVGLNRFENKGTDYFLACDPDYVYRYDLTTKFYKLQGFAATGFAGPFTGSATDYFSFTQVDDYVVLTNNVDPVCKWDPALAAADSVVEMPSDWVTPGTNELDAARIVVAFRGRLVYINTVESTTRYHTRARWTDAGTATGWRSASDYSDAPKDLGEAVTAAFIGDRLFVGFHHGWMELVRRPGDSEQAFEWSPVISRFGAVSSLSTIQDNERLLSRSETTMQSLDPNGQIYLDVQIPDLLLGLSTRYLGVSVSVRDELERTFLWTAVSRSGSRPDLMVAAVYDEKNSLSWSLYNLSANVFSSFDKQDALTWNQLGPATWNQYAGQTWNQLGAGSQGTERILVGYKAGTIYVRDGSNKDYYWTGSEVINMVLETQKLSPIPGQRSHFGWLDVFLDIQASAELRISFYADESQSPYLVLTVDFVPAVGSTKVYKRLPVGRTASFHKFKIETLDDTPIAFDAFVPWFRPAGRLRNF